VLGENVAGIINMELDQVLSDLEGENYTCQPIVIPACAVNAHHRRDRVWIIAHSNDTGTGQQLRADNEKERDIRGNETSNVPEGCVEYNVTNTEGTKLKLSGGTRSGWERPSDRNWNENWIEVATRLCTLVDGIPGGLVQPKGWRVNALKAAGNAIVPQVAYEIFMAMKECDEM
jgi:DNA (cytosine-5)-methyltransferase 1